MKKTSISLAVLALVLAAGPASQAQEADPVRLATQALGGGNAMGLRYSGSGSAYQFGVDADGNETRDYTRVVSWSANVDLASGGADIRVTRRVGEEDQAEERKVDSSTSWDAALDYWLNPYVFLRTASSREVHTETTEDLGLEYTVVSFEASPGHMLSGYIDSENVLRTIRTTLEDPVQGERTVEESYRLWEDFDGIRFPSLMIRKENDSPTLILVVSEVEAGG